MGTDINITQIRTELLHYCVMFIFVFMTLTDNGLDMTG